MLEYQSDIIRMLSSILLFTNLLWLVSSVSVLHGFTVTTWKLRITRIFFQQIEQSVSTTHSDAAVRQLSCWLFSDSSESVRRCQWRTESLVGQLRRRRLVVVNANTSRASSSAADSTPPDSPHNIHCHSLTFYNATHLTHFFGTPGTNLPGLSRNQDCRLISLAPNAVTAVHC